MIDIFFVEIEKIKRSKTEPTFQNFRLILALAEKVLTEKQGVKGPRSVPN